MVFWHLFEYQIHNSLASTHLELLQILFMETAQVHQCEDGLCCKLWTALVAAYGTHDR